MALVEPLVGHLLSQYAETVLEGLEKIKKNAAVDPNFAVTFVQHAQAVDALKMCLQKPDFSAETIHVCCALIEGCGSTSRARANFLRELFRGESFTVIRKAITVLSEAKLPLCMAALRLLTYVAEFLPKLVLARFNHAVPLDSACFRLQLPYGLRRVRGPRTQFLLQLATSRYNSATTSTDVMCSHGFFTHIIEDAAELLQEGSEQGMRIAKEAIHTFETQFIASKSVSTQQKRAVLLGQRSILRLLVKALEYPPAAEAAAQVLYRVIVELAESPSDYASSHLESVSGQGMPNYLLFTLLRQLRPKCSPLASHLVVFLLHTAPDLIRPFFARVSVHMTEEGGSTVMGRVASSTARVATLNVMTRILQLPLPYHLAARQVTLEPVATKVRMFYTMSPREVADEICPAWVAEYVHRLVNGSTNLLMLTFAMQFTQAALIRAQAVMKVITEVQEADKRREATAQAAPFAASPQGEAKDWEAFNANVRAFLAEAVPKREEFWHRMTQQLQPQMIRLATSSSSNNTSTGDVAKEQAKMNFVYPRMLILMDLYDKVLDLRQPWLSAAPVSLPQFKPSAHPIAQALREGNDIFLHWPATSISALCALLMDSLSKGIAMVKMHHITMTNPRGGITEWPVLLSLLLWGVKHRASCPTFQLSDSSSSSKLSSSGMEGQRETLAALLWISRLLQYVIQSVLVSCGCEMEEAMLWLLSLEAETIPCFLHLLNHVLQRSLSKAADRVALELFDAEGKKGVLVMASAAFLAKLEEKETGTQKATKDGKDKGKSELWLDDLQYSLPAFQKVVTAVDRAWPSRHPVCERIVTTFAAWNASAEDTGRRTLVTEQPPSVIAESSATAALVPLHEQLRQFCQTLRSPVAATASLDVAVLEQLQRLPLVGGNAKSAESVLSFLSTMDVEQWALEGSFCWELAARLLRDLSGTVGPDGAMLDTEKKTVQHLVELSLHLLHAVGGKRKELVKVMTTTREAVPVSFVTLLLAALRVLLTAAAHGAAVHASPESVTDLLIDVYGATLGIADRCVYACLLTAHYLEKETLGENDENINEEEEDDDQASDAEEEDDDDEEGGKPKDAKAKKASPTRTSTQAPRRKGVYRSALVPSAFPRHRYLIQQQMATANHTPEADMLTFMVEGWTEDDMRQIAMDCPSRLHNTVLCHSRNTAWDLFRSAFPEVSTEADTQVYDFETYTYGSLVDPRYLLPLLQTAVSLPVTAQRRYWGICCLPLMVRALSFSDATLRRLAAAALATAYMPKGPGLIIATFVRMKLFQLHGKSKRKHTGKKAEAQSSVEVPRLPAPLSAFLVLVQHPIGQYRHSLHNFIIRYLSNPSLAIATSVPFAQWLTSFPLECLSTPLMIEKQQALLKTSSGLAHTKTQESIEQLREDMPHQLEFMLDLAERACQTNGDAAALIDSGCVEHLSLLAYLVTSSVEMRHHFVRVLAAMCHTSHDVALQLATEGGMLLWLLTFSQHLCREYGAQPHLYAQPFFVDVLRLLKTLCVVLHHPASRSAGDRHRGSETALKQMAFTQVQTLRHCLVEAGVTAQETRQLVDETLQLWEPSLARRGGAALEAHQTEQDAVVEEEKKDAGAGAVAETVVRKGGEGKRPRSSPPPKSTAKRVRK